MFHKAEVQQDDIFFDLIVETRLILLTARTAQGKPQNLLSITQDKDSKHLILSSREFVDPSLIQACGGMTIFAPIPSQQLRLSMLEHMKEVYGRTSFTSDTVEVPKATFIEWMEKLS